MYNPDDPRDTLDNVIAMMDDMERREYDARFQHERALVNRLTVSELRVLLVHYKLTHSLADAREWSKIDMVLEIAHHRALDGEC